VNSYSITFTSSVKKGQHFIESLIDNIVTKKVDEIRILVLKKTTKRVQELISYS